MKFWIILGITCAISTAPAQVNRNFLIIALVTEVIEALFGLTKNNANRTSFMALSFPSIPPLPPGVFNGHLTF